MTTEPRTPILDIMSLIMYLTAIFVSEVRLCYSHSVCPSHILPDDTIMGRSNRDKTQSPVGCLSMKGIPATVGGSLN